MDIHLDDLLAGHGAFILDGDRGFEAVGGSLHDRVGIHEVAVSKTVTERIGDLYAARLEVTVAHPDALGIIGIVHILLRLAGPPAEATALLRIIAVREVGGGRVVHEIHGEGHRKLTGRVHLAGQDIGHGVGSLLARGPGQDDGVHHVLPGGGLDDTADVQDHDHLLAGGVVGGTHIAEQIPFHRRQLEVIDLFAVGTLAGVAAEDHDGDVIGFRLIADGGGRDGDHGEFAAGEPGEGRAGKGGLGLVVGDIGLIVVGQGLVQGEAGAFHRVLHVHDVGLVHIAGTGPAGDEIEGGNAIEGDFLIPLEREGLLLVAEQDDGLCGGLAGHGGMGLQVRLVGELVTLEVRGADDVVEHVADVAVQFLLGNGAILDTRDDAVDLVLVARFHQVVAGLGGLHGAGLVAPVGHDDTLESPLVPENGGQEVQLLLGIFAVELVIGGHDGPGFGLLHGDLEILQVDLAEGALADAGVVLVAVGLLVVRRVVLDGSAHPVGLDASDVGRGHLAGEERILGEILEVTSAQRVAVDVHTRGEEDVHAVFQDFVAHGFRHLLHHFRIPGARKEGSHRETGAVVGVAVTLTGRLDAQAGRAVGEDGAGDAQTFDRTGVARRTGDLPGGTGGNAVHHSGTGAAHQERRFLLQGHRLQHFFDVVFAKLRLREGAERKTQRGNGQ